MEDETMSEEIAFKGSEQQEDVFKFDPVKDEAPALPIGDANASEENDSDSQEDNKSAVSEAEDDTEAEEKRVPYSRFKSKVDELKERDSVISDLEARLSDLETARVESDSEEIDVPKEWVELYGDSDVSKRAFKIQMQREEALQENAVRRALAQFKEEAIEEENQLAENEDIIDDNLSELSERLGKKITPAMEEDILAIVDEFSPVGRDGKYVTLFPFDKAYEIYSLRKAQTTVKTVKARNQVADLTGNSSEGEVDSSETSFKRGWDSWREAL